MLTISITLNHYFIENDIICYDEYFLYPLFNEDRYSESVSLSLTHNNLYVMSAFSMMTSQLHPSSETTHVTDNNMHNHSSEPSHSDVNSRYSESFISADSYNQEQSQAKTRSTSGTDLSDWQQRQQCARSFVCNAICVQWPFACNAICV